MYDFTSCHQVKTLSAEANKLSDERGDQADDIRGKQGEMENNWEQLRAKAMDRKNKLDDSYNLHRFLSDYRDLVSWIHDMKTIIAADETAKDVAGAEALLERHQEHKVSIFKIFLIQYILLLPLPHNSYLRFCPYLSLCIVYEKNVEIKICNIFSE